MEQTTPPTEQQPAVKPGESPEIDLSVKVRFQREGETLLWDKEKFTELFLRYGKINMVVLGKDKKVRLSGERHKKIITTVLIVYTRVDHA